MRKLLILALAMFLLLPACGGGMTIKSDSQAASYSQQYKKIVLYNGTIYKNGKKFGKYEVTNTDGVDELVTYKKMDGTVVATMELKGVSPETAVLNLSDGIAVTLKMREMEIDVNAEDGAIYLIKEMILTEPKEIITKNTVNNVEEQERLKAEHKEANTNLEIKNNDVKTNVTVTGNQVGNIDLRYGFKVGQKLHYKSIENTTIKIAMDMGVSGMDMGAMPLGKQMGGMTAKFMTETDFNLNIISINADKTANFETIINSFKVYSMPNKKLVASDYGMKGLKAKGIITNKGVVTFLEDIYIIKAKNGETLLVSGKASNKNGKLSTSASAQAGGEKVNVQATFDPKTGKLTGSSKVTKVKVKKPAKKVVKVTKEDNKIDILPKKIMGLFLLPENKISLGQKVTFSAPMMKVIFNATQGGKPDCLKLHSNFMTDKNNIPAGMDKEMMAMQPNMNAKIDARFNYKKGRLKSIEGVINTNLSVQGMKMDVHSEIKMKKQDK